MAKVTSYFLIAQSRDVVGDSDQVSRQEDQDRVSIRSIARRVGDMGMEKIKIILAFLFAQSRDVVASVQLRSGATLFGWRRDCGAVDRHGLCVGNPLRCRCSVNARLSAARSRGRVAGVRAAGRIDRSRQRVLPLPDATSRSPPPRQNPQLQQRMRRGRRLRLPVQPGSDYRARW